jgi:hypothetical protein
MIEVIMRIVSIRIMSYPMIIFSVHMWELGMSGFLPDVGRKLPRRTERSGTMRWYVSAPHPVSSAESAARVLGKRDSRCRHCHRKQACALFHVFSMRFPRSGSLLNE